MKNKKSKERGASIIGLLILAVIVVLVLNLFKINLRSFVDNKGTTASLNSTNNPRKSSTGLQTDSLTTYIWEHGGKDLWENYLKEPATYLWNGFINIFWNSFLQGMTGKGINFQNIVPQVPVNGIGNSNQNAPN